MVWLILGLWFGFEIQSHKKLSRLSWKGRSLLVVGWPIVALVCIMELVVAEVENLNKPVRAAGEGK